MKPFLPPRFKCLFGKIQHPCPKTYFMWAICHTYWLQSFIPSRAPYKMVIVLTALWTNNLIYCHRVLLRTQYEIQLPIAWVVVYILTCFKLHFIRNGINLIGIWHCESYITRKTACFIKIPNILPYNRRPCGTNSCRKCVFVNWNWHSFAM